MAALMVLGCSPVEAKVDDLDMTALRDAGLVRRIDHQPGKPEFSLTREGEEVLRVLTALTTPEDVGDRPAASGA